jgi:hypothetical protein
VSGIDSFFCRHRGTRDQTEGKRRQQGEHDGLQVENKVLLWIPQDGSRGQRIVRTNPNHNALRTHPRRVTGALLAVLLLGLTALAASPISASAEPPLGLDNGILNWEPADFGNILQESSGWSSGEELAETRSALSAPTPVVQPEAAAVPSAPVLSVSGETVQWEPIGPETTYVVAISNAPRGSSNRTTRYLHVQRTTSTTQTYTPSLQPGETAYIGVSAEGGEWSETEATITAPPKPTEPEGSGTAPEPEPEGSGTAPEPEPEPETGGKTPTSGTEGTESDPIAELLAPILKLTGPSSHTITWKAIPGVTSYTLATILNPTTTRETTYTTVSGTSVTPPARAGQTVSYGVAGKTPIPGPWAAEVTITYPPEEKVTPTPPTTPEPTPTPAPLPAGKIVGVNDGAGWGTAFAGLLLGDHITWNRVEIGSSNNPISASNTYGFHNLAIVGNPDDNTPLSELNPTTFANTITTQLRNNPNISIAEAGNEMYLKGGIANPQQYGKLYLAAANALKNAGIHTPLLFNMFGDYARGTWAHATSWSQDTNNGGWLRDALNANPGLAQAILNNGLSSHPYGALGENTGDYSGTNAIPAQEKLAQTLLGATPPIYITEFGYNLSQCGAPGGACNQQEQATKLQNAYNAFLNDPHVAGIWWYQAHDDSTGNFGLINTNNTPRPALTTLTNIATQQGQ